MVLILDIWKKNNEVLNISKKWGVRTQVEGQMGVFRDCLSKCESGDLGFSSPPFTWCDNCDGNQRILEIINRALANLNLCAQFPNVSVNHGLAGDSNHCPLWVDTFGIPHRRWAPKTFHLEAMWVGEN